MGFIKRFLLILVFALSHYQSAAFEVFQQKVIVNSSELCVLTITPALFGWNVRADTVNQIEYNARISQAPDLPHWLYYTYDGSTSTGLLYGVPPPRLASIDIDVIAWNRNQSYEVRKLIISFEIDRKPKHEFIVELKVDNMNVKDLSNPRRMSRLLNIFTNYLDWTHEDGAPPTPAYMASAVQLGETQVSLTDAEGVVLHLGSNRNFSAELYKLQSEVFPLWKLRPCPRDLKRTKMEKYFRGQGFLIDWCSFQLTITSEDASLNSVENLNPNSAGVEEDDSDDLEYPFKTQDDDLFQFKTSIPERGYAVGILLATIVPGTIGGLVGFLLLVLLWSDRDEATAVCRQQNGNGNNGADLSQKRGDYQHYRPPSEEEDFVLMTGEDERFVPPSEDREITTTPLPPQYGATHPNGSPALTYAV